ncbi:hypothetical protein [Acinetobacter sp. PK01]|uniref:hypothetical protein n=1 Tax=Acinetobacter sp. PK01 TaxID=2930198 RepID=UPI001FB79951|nr:hypothetical protein [Acinetobacter sp. PK01]UOG18652.1 hypothetical protein MP622_03310 [Acinetobacter sp. PK01]
MLNILIGCFLGFFICFVVFRWVIPNLPESFKEKVKKYFVPAVIVAIILLALILYFFLPLAFKFVAINLWGIPETIKNSKGVVTGTLQLTDLGPLGDIYGSLNTLFTSLTLGVIAYTAILQYRVSKVMQKDSFKNMFYSLLEQNREIINSIKFPQFEKIGLIKVKSETWDSVKIFSELSDTFTEFLEKNHHRIESLTKEDVRKVLRNFVTDKTKNTRSNGFYSSFKNYKSLINYVKHEEILNEEEKSFYFSVIRNSMYYGEKKALLLLVISSSNDEYLECFKDTSLLDLKLKILSRDLIEEREKKERLIRFIKHFKVDPSLFKNGDLLK